MTGLFFTVFIVALALALGAVAAGRQTPED